MKMLIVDDDKVTRDLLKEIFEKEGYAVALAASGEQALAALRREPVPLVLSDIRMMELNGVAVLEHIQRNRLPSVVLLMTGFGTMEGAIEAIQKGAFDYISKPFKILELKSVVAPGETTLELMQAPQIQTQSVPFAPKSLIGKSAKIVEVYKTLARATMSPSNVLIIGESGTGKELVARGIHDHSPRRRERFVAVNCGALSENLLESELFGHVKGAFTGALGNKPGLFEEAHLGTLFLDEIGDITPALQVKLLRVIQEGEFKAVGSNETRKIDVRIIAATHCNLENFVAVGRFREDLFYRLKVIMIELPALRERMEDLPDLVNLFVVRYSERIRREVSHVSPEALELLRQYSWPGNVRELEHAIERAVTMTKTTILYPEDFPPEISHVGNSEAQNPSASSATLLEEVERAHILRVLEESRYNKSKAASLLGIDRKTLHRKAQRYKIALQNKEP